MWINDPYPSSAAGPRAWKMPRGYFDHPTAAQREQSRLAAGRRKKMHGEFAKSGIYIYIYMYIYIHYIT